MTHIRMILVWVVFLVAAYAPGYAFLRVPYEDAQVVERSQLIVVGHLKEGSAQYQPFEGLWVHRATLIVSEVIKGDLAAKEIPVIIHYGLSPVVGGSLNIEGKMSVNLKGDREDYPPGIIEIVDTGSSARGGGPLVKDARNDNLWFLRRRSGAYGRGPGTGDFGIVDPEDLRSLEEKDYFLLYVKNNDPEAALAKYAADHPVVAERAQRYLNHREIERITKTADPTERFDKLLPFYLKRTLWGLKNEAKEGIVSCGAIAGEKLVPVFNDPARAAFRQQIIGIWREVNYREAVPILIELLKAQDRFWADQNLEEGWWDAHVGSDLTRRRHGSCGEIYEAVCALRGFKDPQAREAIELTMKRWRTIPMESTQIVDQCEAALKELSPLR